MNWNKENQSVLTVILAVVITDILPHHPAHPRQPPQFKSVIVALCFSAFWRTQRVNEIGPRCLAGAGACPSPIGPPHCFNLPTTALWKLSQIWVPKKKKKGRRENKSANNIQMVPRLCSELCLKEWQVQPNHVEFFTLCHCLPTLTPSWAFSARPVFCQASLGHSPARTAGLAPSKDHAESDSSLYFKKTKRSLDAPNVWRETPQSPKEGHCSEANAKYGRERKSCRPESPVRFCTPPPPAFDWSSIENVIKKSQKRL